MSDFSIPSLASNLYNNAVNNSYQTDQLELRFFHQQQSIEETPIDNIIVPLFNMMGIQERDPDIIDNFVSVVIESDYFSPIPDGLTFRVEGNTDAVQFLYKKIKRGTKVAALLNDIPIMIAYVFKIEVMYGMNGTQLQVECKDLLEYMSQAIVYPNMGGSGATNSGGVTNFHFQGTDTLNYAINTLLNEFRFITGEEITAEVTDIGDLTFIQGFEAGLKQTGNSTSRNFDKTLEKLTMPNRGESFLAYIVRLLKHTGLNIKMSRGRNVVIIKPPTYDRDFGVVYNLQHLIKTGNLDSDDTSPNNIEQAHYSFNADQQPNVIILDCQMNSGAEYFYQGSIKGVAINELIGYDQNGVPTQSVQQALNQLVGQNGLAYTPVNPNSQLYSYVKALPFKIEPIITNPFYGVDVNAHSNNQILYAACKMLAEHQDRFFEAVFKVKGWTYNGMPWVPDLMVNVTDNVLTSSFASSPTSFILWIRRVTFRKDMNGSYTELVCTLPYTHNFDRLPSSNASQPNPIAPKPKVNQHLGIGQVTSNIDDDNNQTSGALQSYAD